MLPLEKEVVALYLRMYTAWVWSIHCWIAHMEGLELQVVNTVKMLEWNAYLVCYPKTVHWPETKFVCNYKPFTQGHILFP